MPNFQFSKVGQNGHSGGKKMSVLQSFRKQGNKKARENSLAPNQEQPSTNKNLG